MNKKKRDEAIEWQRHDPLASAEKLTGKSYKEDPETAELGFIMNFFRGEQVRKRFSELGDTFSGMSWEQFVDLIKSNGFEIIFMERFRHSPSYNEGRVDRPYHLIAAHPEAYLLLNATSYLHSSNDEVVNGVAVHGTIAWSGELSDEQWRALRDFSHGPSRKIPFQNRMEFSLEGISGVFSQLSLLSQNFRLVHWNDDDRFLWLMNYAQEEEESGSWKKIRDDFLETAPDWVRQFILPSMGYQIWYAIGNALQKTKRILLWPMQSFRSLHARWTLRKYTQ